MLANIPFVNLLFDILLLSLPKHCFRDVFTCLGMALVPKSLQ